MEMFNSWGTNMGVFSINTVFSPLNSNSMVSENSETAFSVQMERTRASYTLPSSKSVTSKLLSHISSLVQLSVLILLYWISNNVSFASPHVMVVPWLVESSNATLEGISIEQLEIWAPETIREKS